jgi:hypothetical protein
MVEVSELEGVQEEPEDDAAADSSNGAGGITTLQWRQDGSDDLAGAAADAAVTAAYDAAVAAEKAAEKAKKADSREVGKVSVQGFRVWGVLGF